MMDEVYAWFCRGVDLLVEVSRDEIPESFLALYCSGVEHLLLLFECETTTKGRNWKIVTPC